MGVARLPTEQGEDLSPLSAAPLIHPDFTLISKSEGLTIRLVVRGGLVASKQVVAGSIPVSRSGFIPAP
jgi:hypothetical protein